ncbi:MAG: RHS repeat domain-containing protein [Thermoanaerobaculia bacterium]
MMPASGGGGAVFPFSDDFESGDICAWSVAVGWGGTECPIGPEETTTYATYDSSGRLHQLAREGGAAPVSIFYFAGRPVATWDPDPDVQFRLLTTDHLGTPIHQMTLGGTTDWLGGFEPYGGDFAGAANAGLFLRLPGHWNDGTWTDAALGTEISYNVHRWYESGTGRYTRPDPLGPKGDRNRFSYAEARPTIFLDRTGLKASIADEAPGAACRNCGGNAGKIGEAANQVCSNVKGDADCRNVLSEYGLLGCFGDKCKKPIPVYCEPKQCGDVACGGPCVNTSSPGLVYVQPLAFTQACDPLSDTLAHELGHVCGIGGDVWSTPSHDENRRRARNVGRVCGR